jgi:hypothetical protein
MTKAPAKPDNQLLHLVFGGELDDVKSVTFRDLAKLDVVGFYPNYAEAMTPGWPRRGRRWTTPRCAISSSTCTGCSIPPLQRRTEALPSLQLRGCRGAASQAATSGKDASS